MKPWEHADLCLSVAKINAYRNKKMYREAIQWIGELEGKLRDLREHLEKQSKPGRNKEHLVKISYTPQREEGK